MLPKKKNLNYYQWAATGAQKSTFIFLSKSDPQTQTMKHTLNIISTWIQVVKKKIKEGDFPGSPVVEISLYNGEGRGGVGSIPVWGPRIPHASWSGNQNTEQKQYCNKFNKGKQRDVPLIVNSYRKVIYYHSFQRRKRSSNFILLHR